MDLFLFEHIAQTRDLMRRAAGRGRCAAMAGAAAGETTTTTKLEVARIALEDRWGRLSRDAIHSLSQQQQQQQQKARALKKTKIP